MLEKTLESPLDCKEIQPVHPKGDQSWVFTGRTDTEAETPILCCAQWFSDVRLFATPWIAASQAPLSMGFSRPEYWSGLPCPSPGDLPNTGIKPRSPALQDDSLPAEPPGKPIMNSYHYEQCHNDCLCPSVVPRLSNYLLRVTFRSVFK